MNKNYITADSPISFNIRKVWHEMNWWVNATFNKPSKDDQNEETAKVTDQGDYTLLQAAKFEEYSMGNNPPYKSRHQEYYSYEKKILSRLKDSRY